MPGYELIGKEEKRNLIEIFEKSNGVFFAHGFDKLRNNKFRVRQFEKSLSKKFKINYCQCVSSGTAAIKVALKALNIKPGDEVITQAFNFIATIEAILDVGAKPIIANIDETLNMCPKDLEKKISKKTKAIIPVHMLGFSADLKNILKIANKKNIWVIEDNCEAVGSKYKNKFLGTFGDLGIFSFDFGKNITTGEGGCIITNNKKLYINCKEYHDHGHQLNPKFPRGNDTVKIPGFNYRMTEMQGAVGLAQLKKINFIINENKKRYKILEKKLENKFTIRKCIKDNEPSYDTFMFKVRDKKIKLKILNSLRRGIGTKNVPDAMKWHCAAYWGHALEKSQVIHAKKSLNLLNNYIAIPILLKKNLVFYKALANDIIKIK
jgi:8-amino-3,8-dideoxy-alpha-D-manno-octulosonate transaminase